MIDAEHKFVMTSWALHKRNAISKVVCTMVYDAHSTRLVHNWIQRAHASRESMVSVNSLKVSVICMLVATLLLVLHIIYVNNSLIVQLMGVNV